MLILQRKKEQSLLIGDNVRISILDVGTDWVKLAIDAPKDVAILRAELKEAETVNKEASIPLTSQSLTQIEQLFQKKKPENTQ